MENFIFTYGSLVNPKTWPFKSKYYRVELKDWCRKWGAIVNTKYGMFLALTISPMKGYKIKGLLLKKDNKLDNYLAQREEAYQNLSLDKTKIVNFNNNSLFQEIDQVYYYRSKAEISVQYNTSKNYSIQQTYIDVVADGYYNLFGEEGLQDLVYNTIGWKVPITNDRDNPLYPRALNLDPLFLDKIDYLIAKVR